MKHLSVFHNSLLLRLFKLTAASPLTNSSLMQKQKKLRDNVRSFYVLFCPHLHVHLHSLWFYVTAAVKICDHLRYKLAGGSHVFSYRENKSNTQSICADVCGNDAALQCNYHLGYKHTSIVSICPIHL